MGRGSSKAIGKSGNGGGGSGFQNSLVTETLYHGSNADFTKFDLSKSIEGNGALFFGDDYDYSEAMTEERGGGYIYEVKINIRNPLRVTMPNNEFSDPTHERKYIKQAKNGGYDSVIFTEEDPDEFSAGTFYAVFDPNQVKIVNKKRI